MLEGTKIDASALRTGSRPAVVSIDAGGHRERVLAARDKLVSENLSGVEGIARQVLRTLPPSFDLEDLIAVGNLALIHAATRYRPRAHNDTPFWAYARLVVRGAILDSVRRGRYVENTRPPLPCEDTAQTRSMAGRSTFPVDALIDDARRARRLDNAMTWLDPETERVMRAYYAADEPTFAGVAAALALSLSRVRELHAAGVAALRVILRRRAA